MSARKPGRPADGKTVSKEAILSEALALLTGEGIDGMTMRALAMRAGINPMTIYHHFKDRDGLVKALADTVYADVTAPETGDLPARARGLLMAYHAKVALHPSLTLAIFARAALFPDQARRITGELIGLLSQYGLPSDCALRWTHVLVDYTHGAALAAAVQPADGQGQASSGSGLSAFESGLAELLEALKRAYGNRSAGCTDADTGFTPVVGRAGPSS